MTLPPTFHGFADQSSFEHGLTVVGGVLVCAGAYFVSLGLLMGGVEVAVSEAYEATALRRQSATIAGIACFAYFSIAFIFARGGPLLSFFLLSLPITYLWNTVRNMANFWKYSEEYTYSQIFSIFSNIC